MRRIIPVLLLLAAFAAGASAQTSNVTATITDADSQTWNNGTYTISFVQPPNDATAPVWNGTLMTPSQKIYTGSLSGSGVLTVALPDNTFITPGGSLWLFVICPNATAQCTQVSLKVSGASPDLSTLISNATITPRFSALLNAFGYLDVEVTPTPVPGGQYFNVTNEVTRVWSGSAWANQGSSSGTGVTSVTGTAPIASSGGNTPAISCPTCALTSLTLAQFAATTSAQLAGVISDETGTGLLVFGTSPVLTTPNLGTPSAINLTNATATPACATCNTSASPITNNVLTKGSGGAQGITNSLATDDGTTLTYTGTGGFSAPKLVSTVATGTAPLTVTSTTVVPNLNAATLNGATFASPGTIGGTSPGIAQFTQLILTHAFALSNIPTITGAGCGGSAASIPSANGTVAFTINVGTAPASSGCTVTLPTATTGWNCSVNDFTTISTSVFVQKQTASTTGSATFVNYSSVAVATAPSASDIYHVQCSAY